MGVVRAVIAEDEPVLRAELRRMLARLWPELEICAEAEDGFAALEAVDVHAPAVLFLDIEMPGLSGLDVARQVGGSCHIVFVTAYHEHAVAAFEEGAVDYVLKPFTPARLATTVGRLRPKVRDVPRVPEGVLDALERTPARGREYLRWITASQGDELRLITIDEICYFRAESKYTLVLTANQESVIRRTIRDLVEELDPRTFWQIHRGTVINVNAVSGLTRDLRGRLCVKLKQRIEVLPVSDPYVHLFRQM